MPVNIALNRITFPLLTLENRIKPETEIQIKNKYSSEISIDEEHKTGSCTMAFAIDSESDPFHINVEMIVAFSYESDTDIDNKALHKAVQKEAFPYLRSVITGFMAEAYLPPIVIPRLSVE